MKIQKAKDIIEEINDLNHMHIKNQAKAAKKSGKLKPSIWKLEKVDNSHNKLNFKLYQDEQLHWPLNSYLVSNQQKIPPKNGENKRICAEQDYDSDKDIVNSAKQKNKREVKIAILEYVQIKENGDSLSELVYNSH